MKLAANTCTEMVNWKNRSLNVGYSANPDSLSHLAMAELKTNV